MTMTPDLQVRFPAPPHRERVNTVLLTRETLRSFPNTLTALAKGKPMQADLLNWLEPKDLVLINRMHVEVTREAFGIADRARLETAMMGPQLAYFNDNQQDVLSLAVLLISSVSEARPFQQANKRTAFTAARAFLMSNGYDIDPRVDKILDTDGKPQIVAFLETITRDPLVAAELERWLAPFVVERNQRKAGAFRRRYTVDRCRVERLGKPGQTGPQRSGEGESVMI